jgi:hypothetical protein
MTSPASVVFDHIAYAYTPGRWVVQDICLEVQPGRSWCWSAPVAVARALCCAW